MKLTNVYIKIIEECYSVKYAALISRDHILDVDKSILSSVDLEHFESLLDQVTQVKTFPLAVVDFIAQVLIPDLE